MDRSASGERGALELVEIEGTREKLIQEAKVVRERKQ